MAGEEEEFLNRGAGRVVFVAFLLLLVGTLNVLYGIGAVANAKFYVNDTRYILTNLNVLGWVLIILGVIQLTGGVSLMAGNAYGRVIGIIGAAWGQSARCCPWAEPTRSGSSASLLSASGPSTASSFTAPTSRRTSGPQGPNLERGSPASARMSGSPLGHVGEGSAGLAVR